MAVSKDLGLFPVITYAGTVLWNWSLIDSSQELSPKNLKIAMTMTGSLDEAWFYLIPLYMEIHSDKLIRVAETLNDIDACSSSVIKECLFSIKNVLIAFCDILNEMKLECFPWIFYHRVRHYLSGWKNNPKFPNGGVKYGNSENSPIFSYVGASAAQSPSILFLDALLGIEHYAPPDANNNDGENNSTQPSYHLTMLEYLPHSISEYIKNAKSTGSKLRTLIKRDEELITFYDQVIDMFVKLRSIHLQLVTTYIINQASKEYEAVESLRGTGGTSLVQFLKQSKKETVSCHLSKSKQ